MEELDETPPQSLVYEHMKSCERERQEQVFYIEQREDIVKHTSKALKLALFEKEEAIAKHARAENTAAFALAEYKRAQENLVGYDERVAQSKERWEECVKFRMFGEDGECTLSWVTLEMIFSCTWNPRKQKCVRVSHRFQCVCRGFRKAAQSYLRDHASYYINFVPRSDTIRIHTRGFGKEANTQLRFSESNNANELTDTMWNLNLGEWTGFESVLYETTEPGEYAIVLRKWPMDIGNVYILGGKYTPNEHGRICDWRCTPLTKMHMDKWDLQLDLSHGAQNVCEFVSTLTLQGAECIPYSKREAGELYNTSRVIAKVDMSVPTFVAVELADATEYSLHDMEQDIAQNELYAALKVCKEQRNIHRKHTFCCIRVALAADTELADSAQILEFATAKHDEAIQRVSDTKSLCESAHKASKKYESEYKAAKLKWKQRKRFTLFQADGKSEISWVVFELIFAHIWDPINRRCTFTSERFQRTCRGFRKATQSYLKDHPFYPIHFRPGKCTQGVSGQICRWINGYVVLKLWEYDTEERKGFHERRLNLGKSEKFVTVVYETTDDPPNLVVVIQRWPDDTASMPTLMLGGKYKQNEHGNICDLGCMPTTELAPFVWPQGLDEYDVMALQSTASVQDDGCVLYTRNYDKQYHIDYRMNAKIDTSVPCFVLQNI